jgi:tRNA nucleotidyltransferase (CCA-adding enzyme)
MERLDAVGVLAQLQPGLCWRAEAAAVFARIPLTADDPLWGDIYRSSPAVFFYFAAWLAWFPPPIPEAVAVRLRVRKATLEDLLGLDGLRTALAALPDDAPPSRIVRALSPFALRTLLTARLLDLEPRVNTWLDRFIEEWRFVRPILTGQDLRRAGLTPGPIYTRILDRLLAVRLDGEATDEAAERALLADLLAAEQA